MYMERNPVRQTMKICKLIRSVHSVILVQMWMETTHRKKRLEKELPWGIKHSTQIKCFLKQIGVQEIQTKVILVSNWTNCSLWL